MKDIRTSATHPLQIAGVPVGDAGGLLGITFCPGKRGPSASVHWWERDLDVDLDAIAAWNASVVISLIEPHEFEVLGVSDLGAGVARRGMQWIHLPIEDVRVPDQRFEDGWRSARLGVVAALVRGQRVLVHCRGGLGRAGLVAACILIDMGIESGAAVREVRRVRPGAIETSEQLHYVLEYGARIADKIRGR